jgi:hypothetical protein
VYNFSIRSAATQTGTSIRTVDKWDDAVANDSMAKSGLFFDCVHIEEIHRRQIFFDGMNAFVIANAPGTRGKCTFNEALSAPIS